MKQICNTHHFFYEGKKCPFCERERINGLVHKFMNTDYDIEITEEHLKKLTEKFKIKRK